MPVVSRFAYLLSLGIVILFAVLVSLGIHRYSFAVWNQILWHGEKTSDVLLGHPRAVRTDDWVLEIPLMLAQGQARPRFPLVNPKLGEGQYMGAPIKLPVATPTGLFRPTAWGFWINSEVGISWMWWGMELGVFLVYFWVFYLLSRGDPFLSTMMALLISFSSYFQLWSFHLSENAIFAGSTFVLWSLLLFSRKKGRSLLLGLLLGWSAGCLFLCFPYPPLQVTMGYWLCLVSMGFTWIHRAQLKTVYWPAILLAAGILGLGLLHFYREGEPWLKLIMQTTYPGQRFVAGGDYPLFRLFSAHYFPRLIIRQWPSEALGNICEASGFFLFFPLLVGLYLLDYIQNRRRPDAIEFLLVMGIFYNLYYTFIGLPEIVAKLTLWGKVTPNRTVLMLGISDACLLTRWLSRSSNPADKARPFFVNMNGIAWIVLIAIFGLWIKHHVVELTAIKWLALLLVNSLIGYLVLSSRQKYQRLGLIVLLVIETGVSLNFNPVARKGISLALKSPLAQKILELDSAYGQKSKWVVFGNVEEGGILSNLPRMLGVHSVGGYSVHPDFRLWSRWDPSHQYRAIYNQVANATFEYSFGRKVEFVSRSPGSFSAQMDPRDPSLFQLGVSHFIFINRPSWLHMDPTEFSLAYREETWEIFVRKRD